MASCHRTAFNKINKNKIRQHRQRQSLSSRRCFFPPRNLRLGKKKWRNIYDAQWWIEPDTSETVMVVSPTFLFKLSAFPAFLSVIYYSILLYFEFHSRDTLCSFIHSISFVGFCFLPFSVPFEVWKKSVVRTTENSLHTLFHPSTHNFSVNPLNLIDSVHLTLPTTLSM